MPAKPAATSRQESAQSRSVNVIESEGRELRQLLEVTVAVEEHQSVLQDQRRDPHVVGGDRSALSPELPVDGRVVKCRVLVREQNADPGLSRNARSTASLRARCLLAANPALSSPSTTNGT